MENKKSYSEIVAEEFINNLKKGTSFLQKRWEVGELVAPYNIISGKPYRGTNNLNLSEKRYGDPRWMTFLQATELGGKVRKGEKGTRIVFWLFEEKKLLVDPITKKPLLDENGEKRYEIIKLQRPKARPSVVFNASQIDGIPEYKPEVRDPSLINNKIEEIIKNMNVIVRNVYQDRAFYSPRLDEIHMPNFDQFQNPNAYYATLLHEGVHATGHETRMNRDFGSKFGDIRYAKEELRAEIASYMLSQRLGVEFDPEQHYAYVNSWVKVLEEDPKEITRACKDAEAITEYVLSFDLNQDLDVDSVYKTLEPLSVSEEVDTFIEKTYLKVPFSEKNEAKDLGAKWDKVNKSWYCPQDIDLNKSGLIKWFDKEHDKSLNPEKYATTFELAVDYLNFSAKGKGLSIQGSDNSKFLIDDAGREPKNQMSLSNENGFINFSYYKDGSLEVVGVKDDLAGLKKEIDEAFKDYEAEYEINTDHEAHILKFHLNWFEGAVDDPDVNGGKDFHSFDSLQKWFEEKFENDIPDQGYRKVDLTLEYRTYTGKIFTQDFNIDVGKGQGGFDPEKSQIKDFFNGFMESKNINPVLEENNKIDSDSLVVNKEADLDTDVKDSNLIATEKIYIDVPFIEKNEAKDLGAKWDRSQKSWYIPKGEEVDKFKKWNEPKVEEPKLSVEQQFSQALESVGIKSDPHHNYNNDGAIHRLPTHDDKGSKVSGAYALHLNQKIPGGWIKNMKTGEEINWKADIKVSNFSEKDIQELKREAEISRKIRDEVIKERQGKTAKIADLLWNESLDSNEHDYAKEKGMTVTKFKIVPESISKEAKDEGLNVSSSIGDIQEFKKKGEYAFKSGDMVIPLKNIDGEIRSVQTISMLPDSKSFKSFAMSGEKQGMFYQTDGELPKGDKPIYITEGIATADAVSQITNSPVIACFDAGNIKPVVERLREKFPETEIVIASDNDHHKKVIKGKELPNVGVEKAKEVAKEFGCLVVTPDFNPEDKGTDWNDLIISKGLDITKSEFNQKLNQERDQSFDLDR